MRYITTTKMVFLAQGVPQKKHHNTKSIRNNIYKAQAYHQQAKKEKKDN
jgi:hypothetical protein